MCAYQKNYEQYVKNGTEIENTEIKNRFEIRMKNERAYYAVVDLLTYRDAERTAFSIINHYVRFVDREDDKPKSQWKTKAVQQDEEKVLNKIQKVGNAERIREKKKKSSTLKKAENRQNEIDRLFAKMYEDRACEKITERNFVMLSSKYQKEQIELEQQITSLREELSKMEQDMIGAEKWIELIKEYSVPKELTAPLLNAMIEKILIHEATTNEDNERIQEIEIYYRFIGKVE